MTCKRVHGTCNLEMVYGPSFEVHVVRKVHIPCPESDRVIWYMALIHGSCGPEGTVELRCAKTPLPGTPQKLIDIPCEHKSLLSCQFPWANGCPG